MKNWTKSLTLLAITALACLLSACAQMGTRQTDKSTTTRYETTKTGKTNAIVVENRETTTRSSGRAVGAGKSTFEGLDASQNGTSQGLKVKKASQQTDGLAQAVQSLQAIRDLAAMMHGFAPSQPSVSPPASTPPGMKWILAPSDVPSSPQPETE